MSIRVHIESLILDGLSLGPPERMRLERALVSELTRSLEDGDSVQALGRLGVLERLSAPGINIDAKYDGASIGAQIARSVYGSFATQETSDRHNAAHSLASR